MQKSVFILSLNGVKSQTHVVVDDATYHWVVLGGVMPISVKQLILDSQNMAEEDLEEWLSEYHCDNERALIIPENISFRNISSLHEYLNNNNLTIANTYQGYLN